MRSCARQLAPCSRTPPEYIDVAVHALLALAFDLAVLQQPVKPGTGPVLGLADQPADLVHAEPYVWGHLLYDKGLQAAGVHALRCVDRTLGSCHRDPQRESRTGFTFLPFGSSPYWQERRSFSSVRCRSRGHPL